MISNFCIGYEFCYFEYVESLRVCPLLFYLRLFGSDCFVADFFLKRKKIAQCAVQIGVPVGSPVRK